MVNQHFQRANTLEPSSCFRDETKADTSEKKKERKERKRKEKSRSRSRRNFWFACKQSVQIATAQSLLLVAKNHFVGYKMSWKISFFVTLNSFDLTSWYSKSSIGPHNRNHWDLSKPIEWKQCNCLVQLNFTTMSVLLLRLL